MRNDARAYSLKSVPAAERLRVKGGIVAVVVLITRVGPKRFDDDNWQAAAKPLRDGVADTFNMRDDAPCFTWLYAQRKGRPKEFGVSIKIEVIG